MRVVLIRGYDIWVGPSGYDDDYIGFDMILVLNLRDVPAGDPRLGLGPDPNFISDARVGGSRGSGGFRMAIPKVAIARVASSLPAKSHASNRAHAAL